MEVLVPFSTDRPKTRLSDVFSPGERESFARSMLADVLRAVIDAGGHPRLLATADIDPPIEVDTYVEADRHVEADAPANGPLPADVPVTVDARPLTTAVNDALDRHEPTGSEPVAVVMAD
ncbi:2-phospho-L-lactate guanylyltransferase, partial [Halorubrum tibetense]